MAYGWPPRNAVDTKKWTATAVLTSATNPPFCWPEDVEQMSLSTTITKLSAANPKIPELRPWKRFNLYKPGMTFEAYIRLVVQGREELIGPKASAREAEKRAISDLAWDQNHEYIKFS
jgi:hypothetical protein